MVGHLTRCIRTSVRELEIDVVIIYQSAKTSQERQPDQEG